MSDWRGQPACGMGLALSGCVSHPGRSVLVVECALVSEVGIEIEIRLGTEQVRLELIARRSQACAIRFQAWGSLLLYPQEHIEGHWRRNLVFVEEGFEVERE